jgi:hypothetical protein
MSILTRIQKNAKEIMEGSVHIAFLLSTSKEATYEDINDDKEDIILKIILRYLQITKKVDIMAANVPDDVDDISSVSDGSIESARTNRHLYKLADDTLCTFLKFFNSIFQEIAEKLCICATEHPDIADSVRRSLPNAPALKSGYRQDIQDDWLCSFYQETMNAKSNYLAQQSANDQKTINELDKQIFEAENEEDQIAIVRIKESIQSINKQSAAQNQMKFDQKFDNIVFMIKYSNWVIKPNKFYSNLEYDRLCREVDTKYMAMLASNKGARKEREVISEHQQILSDQIDKYPLDRPNFPVFMMALGGLITDYIALGIEDCISFDCPIVVNEIIKKYLYLIIECGTAIIENGTDIQESIMYTRRKELYAHCIGKLYTPDFEKFIHIIKVQNNKWKKRNKYSKEKNAQQRAAVFAKEQQRIEEMKAERENAERENAEMGIEDQLSKIARNQQMTKFCILLNEWYKKIISNFT